jgi:L-glyceraldehyde 3-phosphate reductase
MQYTANDKRYEKMIYNKCGSSGLKLPAISLGLWHNFGGINVFENSRQILHRAFDNGITHFDLANNYGPPYGSAEETFGRIMELDFKPYRDELLISTKAGYDMWPGPYGNWGSKKYLTASLDQSLKRMGLEYVDIFYHHRPDPETPLEETMGALDLLVKQGKVLYVGISNYNAQQTKEASDILKKQGTPFIINQVRYSMLNRWIEDELADTALKEGIGLIAFVPLAQGLLTDKYLSGIPKDSRAAGPSRFLNDKDITEDKLDKIRKLNNMASERGQSLAQMAIAWVIRKKPVVSALIGASRPEQIDENVSAITNNKFTDEELNRIDEILK